MNFTISLILIIIISFFFLIIISTWLFAWFFCKPKRNKTKKAPLNYGLPAERARFKSQGKKLEGWIISKNSKKEIDRLLILTHGWSTNLSIFFPIVKFLHNSGFDMFLYDSRGHGNSESDNPITLKKMAADISAAIDYACIKFKSANLPIAILGHSMGASAAILAASNDNRIEKIIACAPFSDPKLIIKRHIKSNKIPLGIFIKLVFYFIQRWIGTTIDNIAPINRINYIEKDILLVHGLKDTLIPYTDTISLRNASTSKKTSLLKVENRGHFDILRDSFFMNNVIDFINK